MICSGPGCDRKAIARGLCDKHYRRLRNAGRVDDPVREQAICTITDCDAVVEARDLCKKHYMRWKRTGTTADPIKITTCTIAECDNAPWSRTWCRRHYRAWLFYGDPESPLTEKPGWRGDRVGYAGAHTRIREQRGKASSYQCRCGEPARQWAYDHTDPNARTAPNGLIYSLDIQRYVPLCSRCHDALDRSQRAQLNVA